MISLCEKSCGRCLATFTAGFMCTFNLLHAARHQFSSLPPVVYGLQVFISHQAHTRIAAISIEKPNWLKMKLRTMNK